MVGGFIFLQDAALTEALVQADCATVDCILFDKLIYSLFGASRAGRRIEGVNMTRIATFLGSISTVALICAAPAGAQTVPAPGDQAEQPTNVGAGANPGASEPASSGTTQSVARTEPAAASDPTDIVVTAQRRAESLQRVPIAVSAFNAQALERQQISNASDLQLSLPNVTFTKTNFTTSSFTIRGIGDLCVGFSCDSATGIHVNDMPLVSTRLFETEYFDLERVEVLRGPQGTLYGRNATSGVVNFITARPDLSQVHASASAEIGNYKSRKLNAMINLPITEGVGFRAAGYLLKRDGFTKNLFDGGRIDGRDLYAVRGTLRVRPMSGTTLDIIGYLFHESDDRSRATKQLCHRDPTGILGCQPDDLRFETTNGKASLAAALSSRQLFTLQGGRFFTNFGLVDLTPTAADPFFGGIVNPNDLRTVNSDYLPTYEAREKFIEARLEQDLGPSFGLTVTGGVHTDSVDSRTDYNLLAGNSLANNLGLLTLAGNAAAPGAAFGGVNPFTPAAAALIPRGPAGGVCTSDVNTNYTGIYGGFVAACTAGSTDYDRSVSHSRQVAIEAHLDSKFSGPFNFLLGGIYLTNKYRDSDYYVASFGLDYSAGILGAATALGQRGAGNTAFPNVFLAPPFYINEVKNFGLKSYGLFGEAYFQASDKLKFTGGIRYSDDTKTQVARAPILSVPVPYGITDAFASPFAAAYDADAVTPGPQNFVRDKVRFGRVTGRLVADYQVSRDNLVYASYSRGYKSGGINPPVDPSFNVNRFFKPESINAYEIGSKNGFLDNAVRLNLSAFYYDYKGLQLSRIVARTSINDNTDAKIYGLEAEAVFRPTRDALFNMSASYLSSKISNLQLIDPRNVAGGRSDSVIIKDVTNASNCVVTPTVAGNGAGANAFVAAVNGGIAAATGAALGAPVPVPGTNTTGAFSVCSTLGATVASPSAALRAAFGVPTGALPFTVSSGNAIDVSGNELPQAPRVKLAAGAQYTFRFGDGFTFVPRVDVAYTGRYFSRSFNQPIDRINGYTVINAQVQLNAPQDRYFVRAFVQNLTANDAITGQYLTDQSSGLFTNVFTLEPRRFGLSAGVKF
jgi:iron complex outermembrane recepter protein